MQKWISKIRAENPLDVRSDCVSHIQLSALNIYLQILESGSRSRGDFGSRDILLFFIVQDQHFSD